MNVVKAVKYLWKTDWKTIISDVRDYKHLQKMCRKFELKCNVAYNNIIVPVYAFLKDSYAVQGCVKRKLWMNWSQESNGGYSFFPMDYQCKSFSDLRPCQCVNCKYNSANRNYINAVSQYNRVLSYRKGFWSKKIANVK